jgi:hypothetical protein
MPTGRIEEQYGGVGRFRVDQGRGDFPGGRVEFLAGPKPVLL